MMNKDLYNNEFIKSDIFTNTVVTNYEYSIYTEKLLMKYYDDLMAYKIQKFKTEKECVDYINKLLPLLENITYWKNTKALMLYNLLDEEDKETRNNIVNALSKVDEDLNNKLIEFEEI